jgi:hypothetical protein
LDKILKLLKKLWLFKERLVLLILLGFLAFNIYKIFAPPALEVAERPTVGPEPVAEEPPLFRMDLKGQYSSLVDRGPFSYYSDALDSGDSVTGAKAGVELLQIKERADGRWRAKLKTKSTKWWYEGDSFETFVLEKIDPVEQTVDVYTEKFTRTITLTIEE